MRHLARGPAATLVALGALVAGGCGDDLPSYSSVESLRVDAIRAGLVCPSWTRDDRPDGTQAGSCSATSRLFVYEDGDALDEAMDQLSDISDSTGQTFTVLVGENWVVNDANAPLLQDELGGEVVTERPAG